MIRVPAFVRLSLVLATLTASVVILGDFVGVVPDGDRSALDARAKLAESLAVQYSLLAQTGESATVERSLEALVDRNADVRWAALRMSDGSILAETGHRSVVAAKGVDEETESTATDVRVPIFRDNALWATVEIEFSRLDDGGILGVIDHPLLRMIIFFSVAGFLSYVLFLKRALKDLDPAAVIPDRVKAAMDALAEAVLFLDEKERIVLANKAFIDKLGLSEDALLGTAASQLPWFDPQGEDVRDSLPWARVLAHAGTRTGGTLAVCDANDEVLTFSVNCTSITDPRGVIRGALVTFDDLTELQRKNTDLQDALEMLEASQEQIKRQNSKLEFLATRDPLTGCLNRRSFLPRFTNAFDRALEQGWDLSCVMVDIDHFKAVNDRYGHGIGDEVISLVGQMLSEAVSPDDFVCRYGGEEFCVVMLGKGPEDTRVICDRIRVSMPERTREEEALPASMTLTASFGLTSVSLGAASIQEMLEQADKALYAAKDRGRNGVIGWGDEEARRPPDEVSIESAGLGDVAEPPSSEPSTNTAARVIDELEEEESDREFLSQGASDLPEANLFSLGKVEESLEVDLASDLRHALVREELRLCYQPTAELEEGKIVAMEALLRWDHPQLGLLQPGQFIGIAERAGLMEPIGRWVLRETCRQAHSWHETGCRIERVSVNVSVAQLCSTQFREEVCAVLEDTRLSPGCLELELNERGLSQNSEVCASSAEKLRGLGVRIAIDDFAKGTDALDYFPGFPADTVKVGRASVLDLRNGSGMIEKHGAIEKFGSIVTLARDFGVEVVAKGVETREQLDALRLLGCDRIQGYILSPPVAPATASDLLMADRRLRVTASSDQREEEGLAAAS